MSVRVRFAPSPTGPLHIGGVRTALYNYLFAKKHKGSFILRIEDTDQQRFVPGAEDYILQSLKWCGIEPNEGVGYGGKCEPYRQSERKSIYQKYIQELINKGHAYYAFDSPEELEHERTKSENWKYDFNTRGLMKNSLVLPEDEWKALLTNGTPYVVRLHVPANEDIHFSDLIRHDITINTASIDDKVLFKSDGLPTYHFANVVDDHHMEITHVIRGEEWLPSTPIHVLLYQFFGWQMPLFAHLPLILKPDGKGKLSKRDGDKLGMPVFPLEWKDPSSGEVSMGYREQGYEKEAFLNMLAFLGWNPGTEKEIFSLDELVEDFSLERVHKAGAKFDADKTKWFNQQHLKLRTDQALRIQFSELLKQRQIQTHYSNEKLEMICFMMKDRITFLQDIYLETPYLFGAINQYDAQTIQKKWKADTSPKIIADLQTLFLLVDTSDFYAEHLERLFKKYTEDTQTPLGLTMVSLRLILTGQGSGPSLFQIAEILGKESCLKRMEKRGF